MNTDCSWSAAVAMRAKPESEWTPSNVTARDLLQDSAVSVMVDCHVCRRGTRLDVWRIGSRLADTAIQAMRFRCQRCGAYTHKLSVERSCPTGGLHKPILTIDLKPRFWDEGHEEANRAAMARAARRWEALSKATGEQRGSTRPSRPDVKYRCNDSWL
jgi:hypothetical protein